MRDLFKRLGTTGSAYIAGSIAQKAIAIALLPIFTRHVSTAGYGAVEVLIQTAFAIGMLVRFGIVEAMFRFYAIEQAPEGRADVIRAAGTFLITTATIISAALALTAEPASRFLLGHADAGLVRIAAAGLWAFVIAELLLAIFRVEERPLAYLKAASVNIVITAAVSVWLVIFENLGAEGLLVGTFSGTVCMLVGLTWVHRSLLRPGPVRKLLIPMVRFGGPVMSAEFSLFAVNVIDRVAIVRFVGLAEAGLYSIAVKLSQGIFLLLQGFTLAWAPLAYSIEDDERARRFYARVFTYLLLAGSVVLLATSLEAPWIVRLTAAPAFYRAHEAVPLISLAVLLFALYVTLAVAIGRVRRTSVLLASAICGLAADAVLLLLFVPPLGMLGASIALAGCFAVALPVLYLFVRHLFPIPLEWRRLVIIGVVAGLTYAIGASLIAESGFLALCLRAALVPIFVALLLPMGFFGPAERSQLRRLVSRRAASRVAESPRT
ncbi:MAG: hypothetical protein NVS4B3_19800 [Gemmatimonadaceae bacterium]